MQPTKTISAFGPSDLEVHPMTLDTCCSRMVIVVVPFQDRVVGFPFQMTFFMAYKKGLLTGMILQVYPPGN